MNRQEMKEKVREAKEIVGDDVQDPFAQIAFREVLKVLLGQGAKRSVAQPEGVQSGLVVAGVNVGEFMAKLKVRAETDRITAMMFYYSHNNMASMTSSGIFNVYSTIRQKRPGNLSDVIARCIRKGHIIETAERKEKQKAWQITPSGEKYVVEELVD